MRRAILLCSALLLAGCSSKAPPHSASNVPAIKGSLVVANQIGTLKDVVNAMGQKPVRPLASAEIQGVRLDADGQTLRVRLVLGDSPLAHLPPQLTLGPDWFMHLWADTDVKGAPAYFIAIKRTGPARETHKLISGWSIAVCPGNGTCSDEAHGSTLQIVKNQILFTVPMTALKGLSNRITWAIESYWSDVADPRLAWSDWVPKSARPAPGATTFPEPSKRAQFPPAK